MTAPGVFQTDAGTLQFVEFSGGDMDLGDMTLPDPNADKANQRHGKSLESLLALKNKRLQEDLTRMRVCIGPSFDVACEDVVLTPVIVQVAHEELQSAFAAMEAELSCLRAEHDKVKSLNERLEGDLLRVNQRGFQVASPAAGSEKGEVSGTNTPAGGLAGLDLGGKKATVSPRCPTSPETTVLM
jgi:homeobox protein cut-like